MTPAPQPTAREVLKDALHEWLMGRVNTSDACDAALKALADAGYAIVRKDAQEAMCKAFDMCIDKIEELREDR